MWHISELKKRVMIEMLLSEALAEYLEEKRLADLSGKTIHDYSDFVGIFIKYCGDIEVEAVTDVMVKGYISDLLRRDISKSTRNTYIRNMKIFLAWYAVSHPVNYDCTRIRVPKSPKKIVRIYGDSEINQIFNAVSAESDWIVARNKCIFALMLDSGLRQAEVCTILRELVSFEKKYIVIKGKGDKERVVPLGDLSMVLIQEYLELCPFKIRYLFVNRRGDKLSQNAVKLLVRKASEKLPFELSSHKLRHNFATNYCVDHYQKYGSMDAYKLMCLMGHEDLETTKRYLHHAKEIIAAQEHLSHLDLIRGKRDE